MRGEYFFKIIDVIKKAELPPRARRIPAPHATSAAAARNYLRVRGEYMRFGGRRWVGWELPPRARRILPRFLTGVLSQGTTSACAENTVLQVFDVDRFWNYLRVRGEYLWRLEHSSAISELPPRARRILCTTADFRVVFGTTSACAENTRLFRSAGGYQRNYLRVRGEYLGNLKTTYNTWELPPRARRILDASPLSGSCCGTTSACAENTSD